MRHRASACRWAAPVGQRRWSRAAATVTDTGGVNHRPLQYPGVAGKER